MNENSILAIRRTPPNAHTHNNKKKKKKKKRHFSIEMAIFLPAYQKLGLVERDFYCLKTVLSLPKECQLMFATPKIGRW